jgi:hypothetical protein
LPTIQPVGFNLPQSGLATFTVYDIFGRKISEKEIGEPQYAHIEFFQLKV